MKGNIILGICVLILSACGGNKGSQLPASTSFLEADLFNFEKATAYIPSVSDDNKKEGKQLFLKAIDQYRNKKKIGESIPLFTQSLLKNPDPKTYYEYGNALLETKDFPKAISAYHMAEKLDYSPLSKVLYNLACAYSLSEDEDNSLKYLELAIQNGYTNTEQILNDADMSFVRSSYKFNGVFKSAMSGAISPEKALLDLYIGQYQEASFPYELAAKKSQEAEFVNAIAYDYESFVPDMRDERFSRDVGNEFYFVARFPKADNYFLTLYSERGLWMDKSPIAYYLCTYSNTGKIVDRMVMAGYPYFDQNLKSFKISDNANFEVKEYTTQWEKDVEEFGYDENKITKTELVSSTKYRISSTGKFDEYKPLLGMLHR